MNAAERDELCYLSATEVVALVRGRELSPVELLDAVLDRMREVEPTLHAFCTPTPDLARAQANRLADAVVRGEPVGPLAGVPMGIKDLLSTAGIRTTSGSWIYRDFIPDADDIVVERSLAAGAICLGKTNTSEFGYSATGQNRLFPTTRNPWNPALSPGGSSAGSAAAVAAGLGPVALGSDGGCSVRIPAALCGLVGFKPSMGRVPVYPGCRDERLPGVSGWESIEHIGPISRTVADAALMLSVLAGPDQRDRHSIPCQDIDWIAAAHRGRQEAVTGLRIGYSPDFGYLPVDPAVRRVVDRAVTNVLGNQLGCHIEQVDPGWPDPGAAYAALIVAETDLTGMRRLIAEHGKHLSPYLVGWMGADWTAQDFTDANIMRKTVVNAMARLMTRFDVLITPTSAVPAFPVDRLGPTEIDGRSVTNSTWIGFNYPANLTGQPAISIPAGRTADGLPVGLQIIGRHLDDATVLRLAAAFESVAPWSQVRPRVSSPELDGA
ncbi:amidase [Nocardia sp. SYP-A9097]|uniref:amidase n=1 Tax=Nocardia sp. SYP-A9097 TaxID=2663237 RepID=UPI00132641CB|nr:amidase family protein [Nocardia sp. SYP-A9097]MRH90790.1 amidase [Nocardia sp. SYP-A9097]